MRSRRRLVRRSSRRVRCWMWSKEERRTMSEESSRRKDTGMVWAGVVAATMGTLLVASAVVPTHSRFSERDTSFRGISNCRQVLLALKLYAEDHDGKYPD